MNREGYTGLIEFPEIMKTIHCPSMCFPYEIADAGFHAFAFSLKYYYFGAFRILSKTN
jgi:hypothetical protein